MRKGFVYHEDAGDNAKTLPRQGQFYVFVNSAGLLQVIDSDGDSVIQTQFISGDTSGGTGGSGDYLPLSGGTVTGNVNFQGTISSGGTDLSVLFGGGGDTSGGDYLPLTGGTGGPYTFTGNTNHTDQIQSGGTDLSEYFSEINRKERNYLHLTGGTGGPYTFTGGTNADGNFSATTFYSGDTELSEIFRPVDMEDVSIETLGSPTGVTNLKQAYNAFWSAGSVEGFGLTDRGDGSVNIDEGEAVLRTFDSETAPIVSLVVPSVTSLSLTDGAVNYIYVDYNSGNPQIATSTNVSDFNCQDKCIIYIVSRDGTDIYYLHAGKQNIDSNRKHRRVLLECEKFRKSSTGTSLGASGRNLTVSSGKFFFGLEPVEHNAFDTSVAGTANDNVFTYYYSDGAGGWTRIDNSKQINNNQYDDGSGTLATLSNNRYRTDYIYLILGTPSKLVALLGTNNSNSLAAALDVTTPNNLPSPVQGNGVLIGRVIIQKNASNLSVIESAFIETFEAVGVTQHNNLAGLQGGTTNEYYHLTSEEYNKIDALEETYLPLSGGTGGPYTFTGETLADGNFSATTIYSGSTDLSTLIGNGSGGSVRWSVSALTSGTYSNVNVDTAYFCDCTSGVVNISLPDPTTQTPGVEVFVKKTDTSSNRVNITNAGTSRIEGASSISLTGQYRFGHYITNGVEWYNMV